MSHIRRLVLIAVIGGTILAGWTGAATARPIADQTVSPAATPAFTAQPRASAPGNGNDLTLPIVFAAGTVLLVAVGTAGYVYRARTGRGAIA
jgi:hypothetical protein